MFKFMLASICALTLVMTSAYAGEKTRLDGDVHLGTYGNAKNLEVTKDLYINNGELKVANTGTSVSKITDRSIYYFYGAEGGQSSANMTAGNIELKDSASVYTGTANIKAGSLDLIDNVRGKTSATLLSAGRIEVSGDLTLAGQKMIQLILLRNALIYDLKRRVEILEGKIGE